jgi:non-ribosomal peptide synthase protein (TIGR01720 family)
MELDEQQTGLLLRDVHQAFNTEINDILLAGLALALYRWAGMTRVAVLLEGHGREAILEGVNINRTVGWFTTQFPVALPLDGDRDLSLVIKEIKETLRRVPAKGIGYGILRYLSPNELTEGLEFTLQPEIAFNYLGEMGGGEETAVGPFTTSGFGVGEFMSSRARRRCKLDINGAVTDGRLRMTISYLPAEWSGGRVDTLCRLFEEALVEIIGLCSAREGSELTPTDLTYSDLSFDELDALNDQLEFLDELE